MKKIWLITDTHFGHDKMIEYCGRPKGHTELIGKNLLNTLKFEDTLIHLGDICVGRDEMHHANWIQKLPCKKILCRGNHDRKSNNWYLEHGWDFVCHSFSDRYFGKIVLFSHLPTQYNNDYDINIHGHLHTDVHRSHEAGLLAIKHEKQKLLAVEKTDYKPVLLEKFINDNK